MDLSDIIDRFRGPLIGLIASWGANFTDAAEIAQDSFADAYLHREACRGNWEDPEIFGAWLRGIARNKFRNEFRSRRRREKRVLLVSSEVLEATAIHVPSVLNVSGNSLSNRVLRALKALHWILENYRFRGGFVLKSRRTLHASQGRDYGATGRSAHPTFGISFAKL